MSFLLLTFPAISFAQDFTHVSASNAGMAFSSINNTDFWASFNNQSNLSRIENFETGILVKNYYGLKDLNLVASGFVSKYKFTASGITYARLGANTYSQHLFGIPISISIFKFMSIGGKISYLFTDDEDDIFLRHDFRADAGLSVHFKRIKFGYHMHHIALRSHYTIEDYAQKNTVGLTFDPNDYFQINGSIEKYPDKTRLSCGIRCVPIQFLTVSGGLSNYYETYSLGIGLHTDSFDLDFATTGVQNLGLSPHIGLTKRF